MRYSVHWRFSIGFEMNAEEGRLDEERRAVMRRE
jgi:hypothetical protein